MKMNSETEREKWASLRLLARESEKFSNRDSEQFSSSPDPTPSEPTGIAMVTPSGFISSGRNQAQYDAVTVFHTPPEQHLPAYFSSEDQNLEELYSDAGFPSGGWKKARIFEAGLDDEFSSVLLNFILQLRISGRNCRKPVCFDSNRTRAPGEEFGGETVPAVGTKLIGDETDVIVLDGVEEMNASDTFEFSKGGVPEVSGVSGNRRLGKECESMEDACVSKGRRPKKDRRCSGKLDSVNSRKITIKLKCNGVTRTIHDSGVGGSKKVCKEKNKRFEKIDEFRYVGGAGSQRRRKDKTGGAAADSGSGRGSQLPMPLEGKGENARGNDAVELKSGLLDSLGVLKLLVGEMDGGCEDVDFMGTAKRRGLIFPRPRWWSAEGE